MKKQTSIISEEQLFHQVVKNLDIRFGVKDLSTFEVLRIYRECRDVFEMFVQQQDAMKAALGSHDMQQYERIAYCKINPVLDAIHNWLRNSVDVDLLGYDENCRNGFPKNDPLREYISIQRRKLI